ncbi:hypothetical protein ACFLQV_05135, partial [Calditrichota bacterium]
DTNDLDKLERKTYAAYHQDGIIDLLVGFTLLCYWVMFTFHLESYIAFSWMPILFIQPLRKKITYPRLGYVKFGHVQEKKRKMRLMIVLTSVFVLGVLMFELMHYTDLPFILNSAFSKLIIMLVAVIFAGYLIYNGRILVIRRAYYYAALVTGIFIAMVYTSFSMKLGFGLLGATLMLTGAVLLIRFLRKNPLPVSDQALSQ